jgi:hypothetical protein
MNAKGNESKQFLTKRNFKSARKNRVYCTEVIHKLGENSILQFV